MRTKRIVRAPWPPHIKVHGLLYAGNRKIGKKGEKDNPLKSFAELRDARVERNREHLVEEILLISIAAVLSGAESWNDIAEYGRSKQEWFGTSLTLPCCIPSHDTLNRVFATLDPEEMEKGFLDWVSSIARLTAGEVVAIDGKTLCGTRETGKKKLVHMVSAWAEGNGLVLGQRKVDEKSNEITAIPKLLDALELAGTVMTIDAMGCQREIASTGGSKTNCTGCSMWASAKTWTANAPDTPRRTSPFLIASLSTCSNRNSH